MRIIILTIAALCLVAAIAIAVMPGADAQQGVMSFLPVVQTQGESDASAEVKPQRPVLTEAQEQELQAQMEQWQAEELKKMEDMPVIHLSGPETAGTVVEVAGRPIRLPENVYVVSYVAEIYCREGKVCPETPIITLGYTTDPKMVRETDHGPVTLAVSRPRVAIHADGVLHGIHSKPAAEQARDLADFAWLSAQLGTTPAPVEVVQ